MREWMRRWLPTAESLHDRRSLRWVTPLLRRPWLWQLGRRRVALGAAIGIFFGLITPLAQVPLAAGAAVLLRANLPVAVAATLVSNPFTYAPIGVLAYRTGAAILGRTVHPGVLKALAGLGEAPAGAGHPGLLARLKAVGKPLFVGLAVFASGGAVATWLLVHVAWTVNVRLRRRRRRASAAAREGTGRAGG